ncbi:type VII secretion protein EccB [Streptomyces pluripotens]|uniref:Type VII secretion protein EccB n=1 Tax=Streptomyces pluripotens TaxID=1355015 RepID=A0A221P8Z8_9ACTN|nr:MULTISPECIES: type VII secretion protein EccB [Streptomyces]ARP72632.1 type VII secretion protein EccB [Streptomyces pluripotens]ASN28690.1 type VII secretion protein EccB [Streptomyces pluripotens]KIE23508.1 type VII secretion protein EccB [Streptomyces sp. MUSC 125]MCH0560856.1 type VII secretion protein EccB [Streptomyces sp. MUM 16J]
MASRRDQLNAYTFAKRRMLASFVQSSPDASDEGAPRPLRALLPGAIVGVVVLAAFGAWGMFKPTAPQGWDAPGQKVIIASKSTTRYVVLTTDHKAQLHPVLNMASAELVLDTQSGVDVVTVDESILDSGKVPHGVTIGIPYAPDRLPSGEEAGRAKQWAVCERPSGSGSSIQKAAFVLAKRDQGKVKGAEEDLHAGELLYVATPDQKQYVVDAHGRAYQVAADDTLLLQTLVGADREPQHVTKGWIATLHSGDPISFPPITGTPGAAANAPGQLAAQDNRVGMVLRAPVNGKEQYFVVLPGRVAPVSDFVAQLLLASKDLVSLGQAGHPQEVSAGAISRGRPFAAEHTWPTEKPSAVNVPSAGGGSRNTICNVLLHVDPGNGATTLRTWAGADFPASLPAGSSSAYVTAGSGQLYRQFQGKETKAGPVFLVTDTGLRYALQSNDDSATDDKGIGISPQQRKQLQQEAKLAQTRLGYANVHPAPIPAAWSEFLPTGPRLSTAAARQPQGS